MKVSYTLTASLVVEDEMVKITSKGEDPKKVADKLLNSDYILEALMDGTIIELNMERKVLQG